MVDALHAAGIEVILDIVPNHTCEGGVDGTTLSLRGLDAPAYYCCAATATTPTSPAPATRWTPARRRWCGWCATRMRNWVDRLRRRRLPHRPRQRARPPALRPVRPARPAAHGDRDRSRAVAVQADRRAVGRHRRGLPGGRVRRRTGRSGTAATATPSATSGAGHGAIGELASRLTGSEDLYGLSRRRPWASINFVTAHDGFTLRDLVSYERKHNEANGEDNRDGTDDNRSQNFGVEGETCSPVIRARRTGRGAGAARHAAAVDRHADAAGRRRAVAHPGRQQQRLLPGRRDVVGGLAGRGRGGAADGVRRAARGDPPVVGDPAPRPLLPRRRRDLVALLGPPDGRRRLARRTARARWACWSGSG